MTQSGRRLFTPLAASQGGSQRDGAKPQAAHTRERRKPA